MDERLWNKLHDLYSDLPAEVQKELDRVSAENLKEASAPKRQTKSWGSNYLRRFFGKKQAPAVRPNYTHIGGSLYEVRTQAGFKQALKHFCGYDKAWYDGVVEGHPTIYPSVVVFHAAYRGYDYIACEAHAVNSLRNAIQHA